MRSWVASALLLGLLGCPAKQFDREIPCLDASCQAAASPTECQSHAQCEPGLLCLDGSCAACSEGSQCASTICSPSGRCEPPPCATDDTCPIQQICDGGQCVHTASATEPGVCGIATIYFAFDSAKLTPNNQEQLASAVPCLRALLDGGGELVLEAHADALGDQPYSLALAERRGDSVREFLASMGLPAERMRVTGKGALEATGTDEPSRARDRKVRLIHVPP